jgi:small conductance mechanosensitive channel
LENINIDKFTETDVQLGVSVLSAPTILIVGMWVAGWSQKLVVNASKCNQHLDENLFNFLSSMVRYVILAFGLIAALTVLGYKPRPSSRCLARHR